MANQEQVEILKQGVHVWNQWRARNLGLQVDLFGTELSGVDLREANLHETDLMGADLKRADLGGADLRGTSLIRTVIDKAKISGSLVYALLPIVFDFDRPTDKDFTATIKILAGLSLFVIADITNPKSSPLELQATVPDYQSPFVPIIQESEQPFAVMVDLQEKYNWVLDMLSYGSIEALIKALKSAIIDPAIEKHNELRLIQAKESKIRSAKDFPDKE